MIDEQMLEEILTLPDDELEELADAISNELKTRENEREKARREYQEEFDRLLDAMEGDGFYIGMPDYPSGRPVVMRVGEP